MAPHSSESSRYLDEVAIPAVHAVWQFGAFEFDPAAGELRKFGLKVRISPQVACVLQTIIGRAGELITRDELALALWPDGIHVEFEGNLNTIIRDARQALGDSARKPRFVETQFKRGYRFIAPVKETARGAASPPPAEASSEIPAPQAPPRIPALRLLVLCTMAILLAAGYAVYHWHAASAAHAAPELKQLTNYLGSAAHPSFSPDGLRVAFEWNGEENGRYAIWIKDLTTGNLRRLTNLQGDEHTPVWSPDGRDIAFIRDISQRDAALVVVPALGGDPRQLAILARGLSFVWSPDARWIAYSVSLPDYVRNSGSEPGIQAISLKTGETLDVTAPSPNLLGDGFPAFSPDGKWLAFFRLTSLGEGSLYAVRVDPGLRPLEEPRRLTAAQHDGRDPVWLPNSRDILFSAGSEGSHGLWLASLNGGPAKAVWSGEDVIQSTVDAVHGRIAFTRLSLVDSLSRLDLCGRGCPPPPAKRILFAERRAFNPNWSPDGRQIAFESFRSDHMEIWSCRIDGQEPRQLTHFNGPFTGTPRWSPDGMRLAFDSRVNGKGKIFTMDVSDGRVTQFTEGSSDDVVPSWSHDGRWIYFASNRGGMFQVWKAPAAGGPAMQITKNGGFFAQESADRRSLYYARDTAQTSIWKVPADSGPEEQIIPSVSAWQNFALARDGIYFVPDSHAATSIHFLDFASRTLRLVAPVGGSAVQGFSVSPDGRTIVLSTRESDASDLMMLEGGMIRAMTSSR